MKNGDQFTSSENTISIARCCYCTQLLVLGNRVANLFFFSLKTVNTQSVSVSCSVYEFSREICVAPPYSRLQREAPHLAKYVT